MGKGSCGLIDESVNCVRGAIACAICVACLGPILLIVGIALLVSPNHRAGDVEKYNKAIASWEGGSGATPVPGNLKDVLNSIAWTKDPQQNYPSTLRMLHQSAAVSVGGNTDGVHQSESNYFEGISNNRVQSSGHSSSTEDYQYNFWVQYNGNGTNSTNNATNGGNATPTARSVNFVTPTVAVTKLVKTDVKCTSEYKKSSSSSRSSSNYYCSTSRMQSDCYGTWQSESGSCRKGDTCGTCSSRQYLSGVCFVMKFNSATSAWELDSSKKSGCKYPFSSQNYNSDSFTVSGFDLELYSNEDPKIQLEEITDGKNDFGLTAAQQRTIAVVLLILGAAITTGLVTIAFCMCNKGHRERAGRYKQVAGGNYVQYNGQNNQQQVQQQQQYQQQPQQGYQQQQPQQQYQQQPQQQQYQQQPQQQYQQPPPQPGYQQQQYAPQQQQGYPQQQQPQQYQQQPHQQQDNLYNPV